MGSLLSLTGPAGRNLPINAAPGALEAAAIAAMVAGGVRGLVFPTAGAADRFFVNDGAEAYVQDALFPQIEYTFPVVSGAPAATNTATAPMLDWTGVSTPRGARSADAAQISGHDGTANSDLWMIWCGRLGTQDADNHQLIGVGAASGFATSLIRPANSGIVQFRVTNGQGVSVTSAEADPAGTHIYSMRYSRTSALSRGYRDGVLVQTQNVNTLYPGAQMATGPLAFGGTGAAMSASPLSNAGARMMVGAVGNGALTDDGHAAIVAWSKALYGIA